MIREQAGTAARAYEATDRRHVVTTPCAGDILQRIASVVGEIDALKRERHAEPVFDARAKLAAVYFRKRQGPSIFTSGQASSRT
jgi:hypothetical protein